MQQARYDSESTLASEATMLALLKRAARDALDLVQNEFALARAEGRETIASLRHTVAFMLIAATLLLAGGLSIVAAAILLLALWMPAWVAALSVGAVLFVAGAIVFARAYKDVDARELDLPHTRESLNQDLELIKRTTERPV